MKTNTENILKHLCKHIRTLKMRDISRQRNELIHTNKDHKADSGLEELETKGFQNE